MNADLVTPLGKKAVSSGTTYSGRPMVGRELKIVRLMNPEMCLGCAFAKIADVEDCDGFVSRMIKCRRLDCDNWEMIDAPAVKSVHELGE